MTETKAESPVETVDMVQDYFNMQARMEMTLAHLSVNLSAIMAELIAENKAGHVEERIEEGKPRDQRFTDIDALNHLLKSMLISVTYSMILLAPTTKDGDVLVEALVEWITELSSVAGATAAAHALGLRHEAEHIGADNKHHSTEEARH